MKPWEDDWRVDLGDEFAAERGHVGGIYRGEWKHDEVVTTDSGVYGPTIAEAKLIAQAPAMARVLLWLLEAEADMCFSLTREPLESVLKAAGVLP